MFSIVVIGDNLRRPANTYNTLAASAFLLLLLNPNLIFEVGFQLSYSAVLGIVFFQPGLYKLYDTKFWLFDKAWAIFTVSVSAQIATLPFTLYYFHQYPTYSFLSNFIVIPAAFLLVIMGLSTIVVSFIPVDGHLLSKATNAMLDAVYTILSWIQNLPGSVIKNVHLDTIQFSVLGMLVVIVMLFIVSRNSRYLFLFLSGMIIISGVALYQKYCSILHRKIIVYNAQCGALVHLISGRENFVIYESEELFHSYEIGIIDNVRTCLHLNQPVYFSWQDSVENKYFYLNSGIISFYGMTLAFDELFGMKQPDFQFDIVVMTGKVRRKAIKAKQIVAYNQFVREDGAFDFDIWEVRKKGALVREL